LGERFISSILLSQIAAEYKTYLLGVTQILRFSLPLAINGQLDILLLYLYLLNNFPASSMYTDLSLPSKLFD